jgi:hypothetical protein
MYEKLMKSSCKPLNIYKIDTKRQNEIIYYMEHEASQHRDGNLLFQEAYKAKVIKLGYKNGEISFTLSIDPKKKLLAFKQICEYFSKIL